MSLSKKILTISHIAGNIMTSISVITTIEAEEVVASSDFLGGGGKNKNKHGFYVVSAKGRPS